MRSFYARSVMIAAGALCLANGTRAQAQYNAPSILPNAPARQLNSWAQPAGYRDTNPTYGQNYGGYSPQYYSVATPPETPPSVPATPKLAAPETIPGPNQPGQPRLQQPLQKFLPHGQPQTQQPYTQPYSQQPYSQQYQQQPGQPSAQTPYDAAAQSPWSSGNYGNYGNNSYGGGAGGYADGGYGADAYGSSSGYGSGSSGGYGRGFGGLGGGFGGVGSGAAGYGGYGGGYAGYGGGSSCGNWFGGIGGLVMTRSHSNYMWLSNNSDEPYEKVLTNRDADMSWASGQQVMFGRYLNCGQNAIQFVYWGLNPAQAQGTAYESQLGGGDLFTLLNFDSLYYDNGIIPNQNVVNGFDGAYRHQLITRNNFQNFELNLFCFSLGGGSCGGFGGCGAGGYGSAAGGSGMGGYGCNSCGSGGCDSCSTCGSGGCGGNGSRLRMSWLGGFRYFRFTDYFLYSADTDGTFGNSPAEIEYRIRTVNNLFGFQLGSRLDYGLTRRWSVYAGPKMGIYANQMYSQQHVGNDNVCAFINNPSSPGYNGEMYDVAVRRSAVAFLGELDLGSTYRFTNCWSVSTGYRVVAASGVALTTNQIPQAFGDLSTVEKINNNGALLLHGAYFNVNYNW